MPDLLYGLLLKNKTKNNYEYFETKAYKKLSSIRIV